MSESMQVPLAHKLNGSNYKLWKFQVDAILRGKGLSKYVRDTVAIDATSAQVEAFSIEDGKAMAILISSLESDEARKFTINLVQFMLREVNNKKVSWQKTTAEGLDIDYTILLREGLATFLFQILEETIEYEKPENTKVKIFGKWFNIPRQQVAFGDPGTKYKFSGTISMSKPWTPQLLAVRNLVQAVTGHSFNFVLINKYNNGADHIGEHRDNEPDLNPNAPIASLSLGQRRPFVLKHRDARKRGADKRNIPPVKILLENGSLLLMNPPTNKIWYHSLPPKKTATGVRINLTFRSLKAKGNQ